MEKELTKQDILDLLEKQAREFDRRFNKFESRWSKFTESLVKPGLIDLFSAHGIHLSNCFSNVFRNKDGEKYYEIDLFAVNDDYVVPVEVKTTLTPDDVNEHLERLEKIQEYPPKEFNTQGKILIGAVAGITIESEADKYAIKKGLYVLAQKGNLLNMLNPVHPREWKIE